MLKKSAGLLHPNWWQGTTCRTCVTSTLLSSHRKQRAQLAFQQLPILVCWIFHPRGIHGWCPVRATGGLMSCGRYFLASLNGNKGGSKCLMVLRVRPTPTRFPTNSLYIPMENTPLHSIPRVYYSWDEWGCTRTKSTLMSSCWKQQAQLVFEQLPVLICRFSRSGRSHVRVTMRTQFTK